MAYVNPEIKVPIGLTRLYYICFLSGLAISATVYCVLHWIFPVVAVQYFVGTGPSADVLMREYRDRWDEVETENHGKV